MGVAAGLVERVDRRAQLLARRAGQVLGQVEPLPQILPAGESVDLTAAHLDLHSSRQHGLRDAVVQLARDAVAFGVEHLMALGGAEFPLGRQQLGVVRLGLRQQRQRFGEQRRVLQRHRGLPGQDAHHHRVGVVEGAVRGRPRRERADHVSVELDGHVGVPALDDRRAELRELPTQDVVEPVEHRVGQVRTRVAGFGEPFEGVHHPVRVDDQMPNTGLGQRAVGQGEQHPLRVEVGAGRLGDRAHQVLRSFGGPYQRARDGVQGRHRAVQTLRGDPQFGIEAALARP